MILREGLAIFIGFCGGIAVGSGFVAFLSVLGIIPRLIQLSKTFAAMRVYELGIIAGAICGSYLSLNIPHYTVPLAFVSFIGLICGLFIGMLSAALTEVLNVLPILAKRIHMENHLIWFLMALVFGKIFGSLFQWLYFVHR